MSLGERDRHIPRTCMLVNQRRLHYDIPGHKTIICATEGVTPEGKAVSLKYVHSFGDDTMTFRMTDMVVEGEEQPDEEYTYQRVQ